eukprot:scaffold190_cov112-Isochrysis_galbana.AAC.3
MVPPSFLTVAMSRRSTLTAVAGSMTECKASTASGASRLELLEMTLELSEVAAALISCSLSMRSTGMDMPLRISSDFFAASKNASEITVG